MKLSTKGRYGTRALLDVAIHKGEAPVALKDIAQRQQISLSYLAHLVSALVAGDILRSTRGPRGGVWLAKCPEKIMLSEVLKLLEGSTALVKCIDNPETCVRSDLCVTRNIWGELNKTLNEVLDSTTLQDLVEWQKAKG